MIRDMRRNGAQPKDTMHKAGGNDHRNGCCN